MTRDSRARLTAVAAVAAGLALVALLFLGAGCKGCHECYERCAAEGYGGTLDFDGTCVCDQRWKRFPKAERGGSTRTIFGATVDPRKGKRADAQPGDASASPATSAPGGGR